MTTTAGSGWDPFAYFGIITNNGGGGGPLPAGGRTPNHHQQAALSARGLLAWTLMFALMFIK